MSKKRFVNHNAFAIFLLIVQLVLVVCTWHDVAVSQGVGLYLSLKAGADSRTFYDYVVDGWCFLSYVLVILVPALSLGLRKPMQLFRFATVYLAFMPVLQPSMIVHLLDGHELLIISVDVEVSINILFGFVRVAIPLIFVLAILCKMQHFTVPKWHLFVLAVEVILFIGITFFPELSEICLFGMYYLLAVVAFERLEKLLVKDRVLWEKVMLGLIFALLYARGCLKMLNMMALCHL